MAYSSFGFFSNIKSAKFKWTDSWGDVNYSNALTENDTDLHYYSGAVYSSSFNAEIEDVEGFTFVGWYTLSANSSKTWYQISRSLLSSTPLSTSRIVNPSSSLKTFEGGFGGTKGLLCAIYAANHTITFNANGGDSPYPQSKTVTEGNTYGQLATCTRTGHTFAGWYTAASGGTKVESTTTVSITENQPLYAHWTANSYTVTVNPGTGGTGGSCPNYTFSTSNQTKTITLPTRAGYSISSWSVIGATSGTPFANGSTLTIPGGTYGDLTLTPTWTANSYTVTFKDWNGTVLKTETVEFGSDATPPTNPTRDGWTFSSWSGNYTSVTKNETVTATYTPNTYAVTLTTNGGTIVSGNVTQYTAGTGATLPTNVTKTGHTFAGWYANEDLSGNRITNIGTNEFGDKTYYAKWYVNSYNVNLLTNGGTINRGNVTSYTFGNGATLPTDVTRTGFAFAGWYANSDFSGDRVYDIPSDATGDKTFYAKWTNEYTVTFEDFDGTVLKTETVPNGGDATPPDNPVREGYDFAGWDGDYTNVTSDRTITATYTTKRLTVTFKDFDGTTLKTETVDFGTAATAPTPPAHTGYTFTGWSRDFTNVTDNIEVVAIYSGAANYTIRGRRWQRLYTASKSTPVYAAESDVSLVARTICDVPWTETSGNFVSCLTAHPGSAENDTHNIANREYFDAAEFCAGHENGMHRVYAQATCYRFALPQSAVGKRMNTLSMVVSGDPYLRDGARIAVLTNSTGTIPTDCTTCRTGDVHAEGIAKRTVSEDGSRWYGKTERLQFTPDGGLTLGSYLYVFVILENYAYSRGEYVEGSACIQPNLEIGMAVTVGEWTTDGVNLCYEDLSHSYNVCRDGILPEVTGETSGVQTITLQRSGDPTTGTLHTSVTDAQSCIGLRSVYAALYERRLIAVAKSSALSSNAREGAGFVVRGDQESIGGRNVNTWQLTTSALFVPFAVPVSFRADKVRLDWSNWSGGATTGGRFIVWLKRGAFVTDYPGDVIKNPALYDATAENVEGYELLGTIDATQAQKTATFALEDPLGGYVATILLTAFISLDDLNPESGMTLPRGVATSFDVNPDGSSMSGKGSGWKPDITLLG